MLLSLGPIQFQRENLSHVCISDLCFIYVYNLVMILSVLMDQSWNSMDWQVHPAGSLCSVSHDRLSSG